MKLDARFVKLIYKVSDQDPPTTQPMQDIPEGALWVNEKTGKIFIAVRTSANNLSWFNLSTNKLATQFQNSEEHSSENTANQSSDYPLEFVTETPKNPITVNVVDIFKDNSIIAFFPFDSNSNDLAHGKKGLWKGKEEYATGLFNQAAKFDGNSSVILPNEIVPSIKAISLWFNISKSSTESCIVAIENPTSALRFGINGPQNFVFLYVNGDGDKNGSNILPLSKDEWYHVVITQDEDKVKLYLNGRLIYVKSDILNITSEFILGGDSSGNYFTGLIDQVRIFNRTISSEEVLVLYNENYLVTNAVKLLTKKLGGIKREFIYIPGGDNILKLEPSRFIDILANASILQISEEKPVVRESKFGKELYFPDNSAIALTWNDELRVPFSISVCFQIDKINQEEFAQLLGLKRDKASPDGNFDLQVFIGGGKIGVNISAHQTDLIGLPPSKKLPLTANRLYVAHILIDKTTTKLVLFDEYLNRREISYSWDDAKPLEKLYDSRLALGAWIYTFDSNNAGEFDHFSNSGLHIYGFRVFKRLLSDEDMLILAKEYKERSVMLTEYTPFVKVYDSLDQKLEVFYNFDKIDPNKNQIIDLSGKNRNGVISLDKNEKIHMAFVKGVFGKALHCRNRNRRVAIKGLPTTVDFITVCFWLYWPAQNKHTKESPFGFDKYNLQIEQGRLGFKVEYIFCGINTALDLAKKWLHVCAIFPKTSTKNLVSAGAEIWINGERQQLQHCETDNVSITSDAYISGRGHDWLYPFSGYIDQFRLYSRKLTEKEIKLLARERYYFYK